jgi:S-formylglutathione hydrolase FrmB
MDRLVASGAARGALLVLPDGMTRYGGSQYVNSRATGRYEDHVVDELVPWIDARYRTKAEARHRGVLGKSSGGYGALVLGMRHPDVFSAVASHSGDCLFEWGYAADFPKALDTLVKAGGVEKFLAAFRAAQKKSHDMVTTLNIVAMSACYSPNARAPLGFDLPFDLDTLRPRPEVFERWLAHDPVRMARGHAAALRKLRFLFLDCGRRDEWHLHLGARALSGELDRLGIRHVHEEFDDGHMDIGYRYDVSLPKILRAVS